MRALLRALANSAAGFGDAVASERAVRQEALLLLPAVPAALVIAADAFQAAMLVAAVFGVLAVELLNTAVEKLCDHVTPEMHEAIRRVKDFGSAAVFCAICAAALLWLAAAFACLHRTF